MITTSLRLLTLSFFTLLMETHSGNAQKYLFYLHGAIMEGQTGNAKTSSGEYQYNEIISSFEEAHFSVKSEIRKGNTNVVSYAHQIEGQVNDLLKKGVKPADITVVGASKGALIAMYVSTFVKNSDINYVFIAA